MYSRAHLLIEKEYQALLDDDLWGIEAHPLTEDSIFTWTAKIHGLKQSQWEGGVFRLYAKFDEHYKYRPPVVCFHTIPFHPNIDPITGRPCLDFLDDPEIWNESITIGYILASIQNLLSNPVLTSAVNTEAIEMMVHNPHGYKQIVLECVLASQRVEAGLDPHQDPLSRQSVLSRTTDRQRPESMKSLNNHNGGQTSSSSVLKLSFNDYYQTWSGIATSKPRQDIAYVRPLMELMQGDSRVLESIHCSMTPEQLQALMARQLENHNALMYGKFDNMKPAKEVEQQAKLAKIEKMRKIYLPNRETSVVSPKPDSSRRVNTAVKNLDEDADLYTLEADDLLAWTNTLDADKL